MAKMNYRATFADGVIVTRKSDREYNAAWRISYNAVYPGHTEAQLVVKTGFARTVELANACRSKEGPARYDANKRRWISEPERIISFEVVETEYMG